MLSNSKKTSSPKVSILTIAYNQEKYIRQTLESFIMQKTDFKFEIVISDDCSTDKTPEIIMEYARKYPDIFNTTLRKKNIGSWQNFLGVLKEARGEYIALCEGDDYWTDSDKLQKQVNFLDDNSDYALCFHPVRVIFDNNEEKESVYPDIKDRSKFTVRELLQHNFIQTNSVMYRRQKYENMPGDIMPGDIFLHLYHAQFGKIGFIDRVMSVYRRHPGGIWWNSYKSESQLWKKYAVPHLALFVSLSQLYGNKPEYKSIINNAIDNMFNKIIEQDKKDGEARLQKVVKDYPLAVAEFIIRQQEKNTKDIRKKDQDIAYLEEVTNGFKRLVSDMEHNAVLKDQEINLIKSSMVWRVRSKVAKVIGRK